MSSAGATLTDLIAAYDELVLEGRAPTPETFCAEHPDHPSLLGRLKELERLHRALDRMLRAEPTSIAAPEVPGFRLLRPLGRGGMGRVFLAEQLAPRRTCALKLVDARLPAAVERFRREADLAARLQHPAIAAVYAYGVAGGQPYLATELVHGFSLEQLLGAADLVAPDDPRTWFAEAVHRLSDGASLAGRPLQKAPVEPMVRIAIQIAEALAHAHERGVVHRDVKPANVIVGVDGSAKLIDFGIALAAGDESERLTRTGTFIGSHGYAAPEQLRGEQASIGPWSDTYALGATLYEMLSQRTPFDTTTYADRLRLAEEPPPAGPRRYNRRVSADLDALVLRALNPQPEQRFRDGEEMAAALRDCPIRPSLLPPIPGRALRRILPRTPGALLACAAVAVAALVGWQLQRERDAAAALQARYELERDHTAQALLDTVLERERARLEQCLRNDPPPYQRLMAARLTAELHVANGRVKSVELKSATPDIRSAARRCMLDALSGLELGAVGTVSPVVMAVDVRIAPPHP